MQKIFGTGIYMLMLFSVTLHAQTDLKNLDFLIGTWQVENKEQYEVWEAGVNQLTGHGYKKYGEEKIITESLVIKIIHDLLVYEATVPNQNKGKTISFVLSSDFNEGLSFENDNHDFPKKIRYKKLNDNEIQVNVLGDLGKGFSYKMIRQQ